jgi:hypothetical protein
MTAEELRNVKFVNPEHSGWCSVCDKKSASNCAVYWSEKLPHDGYILICAVCAQKILKVATINHKVKVAAGVVRRRKSA